jgi:hypothetical protein
VYGFGWFLVHHLLDFARIYGDTNLGNSVAQKFHTIQPEFTFGELSINLMISQTLYTNSEMFGMLLLVFGIDKDIIMKTTTNLSRSVINTEFMRYMK